MKNWFISAGILFFGSILLMIIVTIVYIMIAIIIQGPNCDTDAIAKAASEFAVTFRHIMVFAIAVNLGWYVLNLREKIKELKKGA